MEINKEGIDVYSDVVRTDSVYIEENIKTTINASFDYIPRIDIAGPPAIPGISNVFKTIIRDSGDVIYTSTINHGMFSSALRRWVFDCEMEVRDESDNVISTFNLFDRFKNGKILVSIDSSALGDSIAWLPYIEEFRKKYEIKDLTVTTFWNQLFDGQYADIKFKHPGYREHGIDAIIGVGWYTEDDRNIHKNDPRSIPMQQVSSDLLDLKREGGTTIQRQFFNVGIPIPRPLATGDKIEVCGNAYSDDNTSTNFGILLTWIDCGNRDGSGNYPMVDQLINNDETSYFDANTTCFAGSYTVDGTEGFSECDSFLVFGMNANGSSAYQIKFSYKISIVQNCNPN